MEDQLLALLAATQTATEARRKHAEQQLEELYSNPAFGPALCSVASHHSVPIHLRQSALLILKQLVSKGWAPGTEEYDSRAVIDESAKHQIRDTLLAIVTSEEDSKVRSAASHVVSKIASVDFPDRWPSLLPTVLRLIPEGTPAQMRGALRILVDLVEDCLSEDQFLSVAAEMFLAMRNIAGDDSKKPTLRAMAVSVFRSSFDILEIVKDSHKAAVKAFAEQSLNTWLPFFVDIMKKPLPPVPAEEKETRNGGIEEEWRGLIALKVQVAKALMRIRAVFPALLAPQSPLLFTTCWDELSVLKAAYHQLYVTDERQCRLVDADGLPFTLDFLVIEELDFLQACLRASLVRSHLKALLGQQQTGRPTWLSEIMKLAVAYAQITTEEEGLWDIDVNVFLSEETSATANYTPRIACGDLLIKLNEWVKPQTVETLLAYTRTIFSEAQSTWKEKEAVLFLLNQLLNDLHDVNQTLRDDFANGVAEYVKYAMQQKDIFLRARAYLVAGGLIKASSPAMHQLSVSFMEQTLKALSSDQADVVKAACVRVLQDYLSSLPREMTSPLQTSVIEAISSYVSSVDPDELADSDDLLIALVETLRDTISLNTSISISPGSNALSLLFTIASKSPGNFHLTSLVQETFEDIAIAIASINAESYTRLCELVLPSFTGAIDVGNMTGEDALTNLATELLAALSEHGSSPLPPGFVAAVMPKLRRVLLSSTDADLVRPATETIRQMLAHDAPQVFAWHDEAGKPALETYLVVIDRLLGHGMDDNAVTAVGGLAAELVERAGSERLGPYLVQLLRAVAERLASASQAALIQSLIMVFARLSLVSAKDIVDFLAQIDVGGEKGLAMVMRKWLEHSVNFAGYDDIRQNVMALCKLYLLDDPRLAEIMVQGDLIVPSGNQIMTRSRTRQMPIQHTSISVPHKIIKLLIDELTLASGNAGGDAGLIAEAAAVAAAGADSTENGADVVNHKSNSNHTNHTTGRSNGIGGPGAADGFGGDDDYDDDDGDDEDEGDWEDMPGDGTLDLGAASTMHQLMRLGDQDSGAGLGGSGGGGERQRDDETQALLMDFFRDVSRRDVGRFRELYAAALTPHEREKLSIVG